ncbi:MAG: TIGR04282 family arsenosugar biosynthesis glycosyltransferase [Rhodospirillales bacterium]|jgi:rSAM/selenodomain-associated transferase 1
MTYGPTLIIFARCPVLGTVKKRLGRDIGPVAATAFYRQCLAGVIRRLACDPRWRTILAVTPDRTLQWKAWPQGPRRIPQGPGDLGSRMAHVLASVSPGPAILIGSDIPTVEPSHIARAIRLLGSHDAVFGPAADGGYWLVGLRRRPQFIDPFGRVRWSSPHALTDTLANLKGARVAILDILEDIDNGASHARWQHDEGQRLK